MVLVGSYVPAVALGIARDAIDEFVALAQGKTPFASTTTLRERATAQAKLGRAEGLLRSARTYLYDRLAWGWDRTVAGVELTLEQRSEVLLACVQAITASAQAVDLVYSAAGTSAIYRRNRIEQHFRDINVLRQQGFVSESRFETVGQVSLGVPPDLGFVAL
jgi:alkylation response protein AidB-like acyl-CoA dehydrogenase